jgi:hypothetical protein
MGGGERFGGDVVFTHNAVNYRIECKVRKAGFSRLYEWLGDNDILTVRQDRSPRLWVLHENTFLALLEAADNNAE